MIENHMGPNLFDEENMTLNQKVDEIYRILKKWSGGDTPLVGDIRLDKQTILHLLCISESTLARWRSGKLGYAIPYNIDSSGNAYYMFNDVYAALQKGKVNSRGFDRIAAMTRMKLYRDDYIRDLINK